VVQPNKVFGVRMDPELAKKLKILAVKKDTQIYKLLEEAITDYLKKITRFKGRVSVGACRSDVTDMGRT